MLEKYRELIEQRIGELNSGDRFNLRDLLAKSWPKEKGIPNELGKAFRRNLADFPSIVDAGKDGENLRWYRKV